MSNEFSSRDDVIDVRDVIARVEHLRQLREPGPVALGADDNEQNQDDLFAELRALEAFLKQMAGYGGDEEWEGDWYPITLIRESYFEDYAQELAEDCGMIDKDAAWPARHIDWEAAAEELRQDYTAFEFEGVIYWGR